MLKKNNSFSPKRFIIEYALIFIGSMLYAVSTVLFVFPKDLFLGGTSGVSVILTSFIDVSAGDISFILNISLIILAFIVLGFSMGVKTLVGSLLTTFGITAFEKVVNLESPPVSNDYLSALIGAAIIAVASGIMFYVGSSSGGTDVIALIIKKFSKINIGVALLITDVVIVITGGFVIGFDMLLSSAVGLVVKTLGIDFVIMLIRRFLLKKRA